MKEVNRFAPGDRVVILDPSRRVCVVREVSALGDSVRLEGYSYWVHNNRIENAEAYLSKLEEEARLIKDQIPTMPELRFDVGDRIVHREIMNRVRTVIYTDRAAQTITLEDGSICTEDFFMSMREAKRRLESDLRDLETHVSRIDVQYRAKVTKAFNEGKPIEMMTASFNHRWIPVTSSWLDWDSNVYRIEGEHPVLTPNYQLTVK